MSGASTTRWESSNWPILCGVSSGIASLATILLATILCALDADCAAQIRTVRWYALLLASELCSLCLWLNMWMKIVFIGAGGVPCRASFPTVSTLFDQTVLFSSRFLSSPSPSSAPPKRSESYVKKIHCIWPCSVCTPVTRVVPIRAAAVWCWLRFISMEAMTQTSGVLAFLVSTAKILDLHCTACTSEKWNFRENSVDPIHLRNVEFSSGRYLSNGGTVV